MKRDCSFDRFIPRKIEANLYDILKNVELEEEKTAGMDYEEADLNQSLRKKESLQKFRSMLGERVLPFQKFALPSKRSNRGAGVRKCLFPVSSGRKVRGLRGVADE